VTDLGRHRILVIDDQPTLTKAIRRMLADHDVTTLASGQAALDMIESGERYDVILSDLMMPGLSGMELHARLQHVAPDQAKKMVFMTGGAFTKQASEFFEHVGNPTIEKPFDRAALFAVIENLLA
jgi:CheY-like chemotaxis protein